MEEGISECLLKESFNKVFFSFRECYLVLEQFTKKMNVKITRDRSWQKLPEVLHTSKKQCGKEKEDVSTNLGSISKKLSDLGKGFK